MRSVIYISQLRYIDVNYQSSNWGCEEAGANIVQNIIYAGRSFEKAEKTCRRAIKSSHKYNRSIISIWIERWVGGKYNYTTYIH